MAQLTGPAQSFPCPTSAVLRHTSPLPLNLGTRARDADGNEYVWVAFGGPISSGEWVIVTDLHVATALIHASVGRVGIVVGTGPTSDDCGWIQVYGLNTIAQTSGVTDTVSIARGLRATSVLTTPLGTAGFITQVSQESNIIHGAWITQLTPTEAGITGASDGSWPTTYTSQSSSPAGYQHSGQVIGVFLNYPYVDGENVSRFLTASD